MDDHCYFVGAQGVLVDNELVQSCEIQLLRRIAQEQTLVPDMVRQILHRHASTSIHPLEVLKSFRKAFDLTLAQAKPITGWLAVGGGEKADADLHALVWPCIEANRESWGRGGPG